MTLILHNLKVAFRNLMKYRLQTFISVLSIAVGIVTLALAHSIMTRFRTPDFYDQPYSDWTYEVLLYDSDGKQNHLVSNEIIRALKENGGPKSAERIAVPNCSGSSVPAEFLLTDSTERKGEVSVLAVDPEFIDFKALRSSVTGKRISGLKAGEAILSADYAMQLFGDSNPIGTRQTLSGWTSVMVPYTIVDIFEPAPEADLHINNKVIYLCPSEKIEENNFDNGFMIISLYIVLRENRSAGQLLNEINERIRPFGQQARISKMEKSGTVKYIRTVRTITYLLGSLILLAAIIGFMRIQIQLIAIRQRELSLRIVNGAKSLELMGLLITEVSMVIIIAILMSVFLANLLQDFLDSKLHVVISQETISITDLWRFSLQIGGWLLGICVLIIGTVILRIERSGHKIAESIRKRRRHPIRDVALCFQTVICIVLVCSTLILMNAGNWLLNFCNVPKNDDEYKGFLVLDPSKFKDRDQLKDEIRRLPDLEGLYLYEKDVYLGVKELYDNPEVLEHLTTQKSDYQPMYIAEEPSMLTLLGADVEWFNNAKDSTECILLSEKAYDLMNRFGLLENKSLTINLLSETVAVPIGGIIKKMPYNTGNEFFFIIRPVWPELGWNYLLVPKPGRAKALAKRVDEVIARLEPENFNKDVVSYRDQANPFPGVIETVWTVCMILSIVSILVNCMGVFSSVTLETRARRKEVAIRKVNGAKNRDILRMFGKVYLMIITFALLISVPVCVFVNMKVEEYLLQIDPTAALNPWLPIAFGSLLVLALIFIIVGYQIHRVMHVDPSKIIAKE